ncbi:hypothetical protein AusDCA_1187 [Desulfitobacterium sp. AusDCA]
MLHFLLAKNIEAILKEVYSYNAVTTVNKNYILPDNLKRFFKAMKDKKKL